MLWCIVSHVKVYCFTCYGILLPTIYISTDHRDRYLSMVHITDVTSRETFTSIFTIKMEKEKELVGAKVVGFYKNNSTELVGKKTNDFPQLPMRFKPTLFQKDSKKMNKSIGIG